MKDKELIEKKRKDKKKKKLVRLFNQLMNSDDFEKEFKRMQKLHESMKKWANFYWINLTMDVTQEDPEGSWICLKLQKPITLVTIYGR